MKYSEAKVGRLFVLRLENNDQLPLEIEKFVEQKNILRGFCILVGGVHDKGKLVTGPQKIDKGKISPNITEIKGIHEVFGTGTIFPDESGKPKLHMHTACGRDGMTTTGCIRLGIDIWLIGEVIIYELTDCDVIRKYDKDTGFSLLDI